ncbi:MAG: hypothetical protein HY719_09555 [Planctomycetes bacterium]|nr:hypothetical protein [Planctomycetota bacterium]
MAGKHPSRLGAGGGDPFAAPRLRPSTAATLVTLAVLGVIFVGLFIAWGMAVAEDARGRGAEARERDIAGEVGGDEARAAAARAQVERDGAGPAGMGGAGGAPAAALGEAGAAAGGSAGGAEAAGPFAAADVSRLSGSDLIRAIPRPKLERLLDSVEHSDPSTLADALTEIEVPSALKDEILRDPRAFADRVRGFLQRANKTLADLPR